MVKQGDKIPDDTAHMGQALCESVSSLARCASRGLEGNVGLCCDFGNWHGPNKYRDLQSIAPSAESCHAKASFASPDGMEKNDYRHCLDITRSAGFSGPYTLIYDGPGADEWAGLAQERQVVEPYIATF